MKILLCISLAVILSTNSSFAKIWRVNNNAGANANFTTLAAAQDTATNGDTIHVEASATAYASITIRKKLVIIGPGYYLGENPNTQATKQTAIVNGLTLYAGGSGSVIMGLDFNGNSVSVYASDVVIRRNKFSSPNGTTYDWNTGVVSLNTNYEGDNAPVRNVIISQNFGLRVDVNNASTGLLISNNYLSYYAYAGENTTATTLGLHANAIAIIQNNIIRRGKLVANNSSIINNIMYVGTFEGTGNLVSNNIGNAAQFGTTNGNKSNVDMATVFIGAGTDISPDGQWKLAASSPAIAAGYGSTTQNPVDAGIYSGQTPYVLSGIPPVPAIYAFENKPIGSNTDPITVTIKVKSNN